MDLNNLKYKGKILFHKYKYAVLVVLIGIGLMLIPTKSKNNDDVSLKVDMPKSNETVQQALQEILSYVEGVGQVKVYLKEASGAETIYETNEVNSVTESSSEIKRDIVTISDSDRNETGLVKRINSPTYQGAIVICQGANDPKIKLAVTDAVSKATGLGADKIAVLIMK